LRRKDFNNFSELLSSNLDRRDIRKKRGAGPTCSSEARVGSADRAVEGGYFPPQYVLRAREPLKEPIEEQIKAFGSARRQLKKP